MIGAKHTQGSNAETASTGLPLGSAVIKEAELWVGAHSDFLTSVETIMTDRLRRQREAFDTSSRSIRKVYDARNIIDLVQAQHEWMSACLEWTAAEIRAFGNETVTMTRKAAQQLSEVARERGNGIVQQGKASAKTATTVPMQRAAAE